MGRIMSTLVSRIQQFFAIPRHRIVSLLIALLVILSSSALWWYNHEMSERKSLAEAMDSTGMYYLGSHVLKNEFTVTHYQDSFGVEFPSWSPKPDSISDLKKAIAIYNTVSSPTEQLTFTQLVETFGPELLHTVEGDNPSSKAVFSFAIWANGTAKLKYSYETRDPDGTLHQKATHTKQQN